MVWVVAAFGVLLGVGPTAAHIYSVRDPESGALVFTNAPADGTTRLVVRELPRPLPVSPLSPSKLPPGFGNQAFDPLIREIAKAYDVEYALVKAIIKAESGFNHRAVSPKGAQGLMQLMPATAAQHQVHDVFKPRDNIEGGVRHLKWLLDRYGGNIDYAVAAYNAGHQRVEEAGGIPNIAETREYVQRVKRYRENYRRERPSGPGIAFITAATR
jgi:soluble lytic murein transglycosylase-like protein